MTGLKADEPLYCGSLKIEIDFAFRLIIQGTYVDSMRKNTISVIEKFRMRVAPRYFARNP